MSITDFKLNRLYEFPTMAEQLSVLGVQQVINYIENVTHRYLYLNEHIGINQIEEREYGDYELRGRLLSRIEQYMRHRYYTTFTEDQRQSLGRIIARNMMGGDSVRYFDIVNYVRWRPSAFGESSGSCWWGGYKYGKELFQNEMKRGEACAIRIFRQASIEEINTKGLRKWHGDYVGMGRCFVILNNPVGVDIAFNMYGLSLEQWQSLLTQAFNYSYVQEIGLALHPQTYINRRSGLALSNTPIEVSAYHSRNFGLVSPFVCQSCGIKVRVMSDELRSKQLCAKCGKQTNSNDYYHNVVIASTQNTLQF